jgi:hypothetical protein
LIRKIQSKDFKIKLEVFDSQNRGAFFQIIDAIKSTDAEILFFLNSDDSYHEKRLEYFVHSLSEYPHAWGFSDVQVLNSATNKSKYENHLNNILDFQKEKKTSNNFFQHNYMISTGNLVLKNPRYYANMFSLFKLDNVHDWYMVRNLAMIEEPVYIPLKLYNYRLHESNTISNNIAESDIEGKIVQFIEQQVIALGFFGVDSKD